MDEFDEIKPATEPKNILPPISPLVWDTPFVNFLTADYFARLANDSNYSMSMFELFCFIYIEKFWFEFAVPIPEANSRVFDDYFESNFQIIDQIGQGSFADAFKVQDHHHQQQVFAVKKTRNRFIGYKDRRQKLKEVEVMLKLGHSPYCVRFHQAWEQRGQLYIQTEFYENGNLDDYLCFVAFDEPMVWQALADLALVSGCDFICVAIHILLHHL